MDKSFDLGSVMKGHQSKHKNRPQQFLSVARGTQRRLENSLKYRKSNRLTSFDCVRNLPQPSPLPIPVLISKVESRRLQLQKWKEEKEKKKKESASKKIKPFITGVPHNPLKYVPPPPAKAVPSSSGRVTRSQAARNQKEQPTVAQQQQQSFAPSNAQFRAPQIRTLPQLGFKKKNEQLKTNFQPIVSNTATVTTRSQAYRKIVAESRAKREKTNKTSSQIVKPVRKPNTSSKLVSSSSSENESSRQLTVSTSSADIDLTAKIISSSESNINSSTENYSLKSLQSTSSCEFVSETQSTTKQKANDSPAVAKMKNATPPKSLQKSNKKGHKLCTPRNPVPKSESSSEEKLRSPKSPVVLTPEQLAEEFKKISPCVTMSRGKENARREMKKKIDEGLLDEDASDMDSVEHFERQLASEIKRLTEICDMWDKVFEQVSLPESVQELVLSAVGQARLLMSQKMQQFAQLVGRCARPEPGTPLVTAADLRGFWDMVFLQVENVDMRFKELEELRARDWVEKKEKSAMVSAAGRKPRARAALPPASNVRAAPSRLRDVIAAARKAKSQEAAAQPSASVQTSNTELTVEERTFDAGFFTVRSPVRSPLAPATPHNKQNLLKAVLSSEAEKASASKKSASFAMLRASIFGKNIDCDGVEPLPQTPVHQINLEATPGRSILKQPKENTNKSVKHVKVVLFNESDIGMNTSTEDLKLPTEQEEKAAAEKTGGAANSESALSTESAINTDSAKNTESVSTPMDIDGNERNKTEKPSLRRQSRFTRQDALTSDYCPVATRKMENMMDASLTEQKTPQREEIVEKKTPKRSAGKKVQAEKEIMHKTEDMEQTEQKTQYTERQKRSSRKSFAVKVDLQMQETEQDMQQTKQEAQQTARQRRSCRKSVLAEVDMQMQQMEHEMQQTELEMQQTKHEAHQTARQRRSCRKSVLAEVDTQMQKTEQEMQQTKLEMQQTKQEAHQTARQKRSSRKNAFSEVDMQMQKTELEMLETGLEMQQTKQEAHQTARQKRSSRKNAFSEVDMHVQETELEMLQTEQEMQQTKQEAHQTARQKRSSRKNALSEVDMHVQETELEMLQPEQEMQQTKQEAHQTARQKRSSRKNALSEVDMHMHETEQEIQHSEQEMQQTEQEMQQTEKQRRSSRKTVLSQVDMQIQETEQEAQQKDQKTPHSEKKTPRRSTRKKTVIGTEQDILKENVTPMRSSRRRKTDID